MKNNRIANGIGVAGLILCAVLAVGVKTFFGACDPKDDGSWMSCHWAEQAVFGLAILMAVLFAMLILFRRFDTKKGVACAIIPSALLTMIIPNTLIRLCMKEDMVCHSTMTPVVRVLSAVIAVVALVEVGILTFQGYRDRKKQPAVQVEQTVQQMEEAAQQMELPETYDPADGAEPEFQSALEGEAESSEDDAATETNPE